MKLPPLRLALLGLIVGLAGCVTHVYTKPEIRIQVPPSYPFEMKRQGIEGRVVLDFVVDIDGRPTQIRVVKSTNPAFEEPAIRAVAKWRFTPGTCDGKPCLTPIQIPIGFKLDN